MQLTGHAPIVAAGLVVLGLAGCGGITREHASPREQAPRGEQAARGEQAPPPEPESPPRRMTFQARAYSIDGRTASGTRTRKGIVAADPKILPLGTRIRVRDAGRYSGEYVVRDTGRTIDGRQIDVYVADDAEAKRFGRKTVQVEVLSYGDGRPASHR